MPVPKIIPVSAAAAKSMVENTQFGNIFVPENAVKKEVKNGTRYGWNSNVQIQKATVEVGKDKEGKPDDNISVFFLHMKSLFTPSAIPGSVPPPGKHYFVRLRVNWAKINEGDDNANRNYGVVIAILLALGLEMGEEGITVEQISGAFPVKDDENAEPSTIKGMRFYAQFAKTPSETGDGFLNLDTALPYVESEVA